MKIFIYFRSKEQLNKTTLQQTLFLAIINKQLINKIENKNIIT